MRSDSKNRLTVRNAPRAPSVGQISVFCTFFPALSSRFQMRILPILIPMQQQLLSVRVSVYAYSFMRVANCFVCIRVFLSTWIEMIDFSFPASIFGRKDQIETYCNDGKLWCFTQIITHKLVVEFNNLYSMYGFKLIYASVYGIKLIQASYSACLFIHYLFFHLADALENAQGLASPCSISKERSCSKDNISVNKSGTSSLCLEPQQMKKRKKGGKCNLRKSLAWDRAFSTEEGEQIYYASI